MKPLCRRLNVRIGRGGVAGELCSHPSYSPHDAIRDTVSLHTRTSALNNLEPFADGRRNHGRTDCEAFAILCACALCDSRTDIAHLKSVLLARLALPRPSARLWLRSRRTGSGARVAAPAAAVLPHPSATSGLAAIGRENTLLATTLLEVLCIMCGHRKAFCISLRSPIPVAVGRSARLRLHFW